MVKDKIIWNDQHEIILRQWGETCACYRFMHHRGFLLYKDLSMKFTLPVIILSTITGTANFAQERFDESYRQYIVILIGSLNILAGIITTIKQFLKISELNEAHRVSNIAWGKFHRNIKVELAKNPKERIPVDQMIKWGKEEFDRLMETSPVIEDSVITVFKKTFKDKDNFKFIKKPEICDELISTVKYKFKGIVIEGGDTTKEDMYRQLDDYIKTYNNIHGRDPILDEMYDDLDIDNEDIDKYYEDKYSDKKKEKKSKTLKRFSIAKKETKTSENVE